MSLTLDPLVALASLASASALALILKTLVPPPRRLRTRVRPYLAPSAASLDRPQHRGPLFSVLGPMVHDAADLLARILDRSGSTVTLVKIRQAGWYQGMGEQDAISAYRLAQLKAVSVVLALAVLAGQGFSAPPLVRVTLVFLALVVGATRTRGRLEKAIETRRELMKIEIYTVNQLLAMRVRAGGGVIQAVRAITDRGRGEVVDELEEVLRLHRAGWPAADAFRKLAEITPERYCSRTYRLLASAEERGADLAEALLSLSEDVRETRRESIKRTATKRRAAMLVPTIAILAPVLILFVAAPLPYLITGWQ